MYYKNYIDALHNGLKNSVFFISDKEILPNIFFNNIKELFLLQKELKNRIFFFGNGASAAFANHMALDFSKNGKILSRSLSDSAMLTALSNDFSYEEAFVEFLKLEGINENDLVVTISSSGNSPNIIKVLEYCKDNQIKSLGLSGLKGDNKSIVLADYSIYVPMKTYGMVECIHQIFLHLILDDLMEIYEWERTDFQNMSSKEFNI
jgi:D-sedoheptulose 7-phosphate isomerase